MSYSEIANLVLDKLVNYNKLDGWKLAKKMGNAKVLYRSSADFEGYIYKLDCSFNAPPSVVFNLVFPVRDDTMNLRLKWDKSLEMLEKIEEYEKDVYITRALVKGSLMGLVSGREFVDVTKVTKNDEFMCFTSQSVTHSKYPVGQGSYIRGFNYPCGIFCFPIPNEPGKTRLIHYIQADLGGKLPHSLIHAALPSNLVSFYTNLSKAIDLNGKTGS